MSDTAAKPLRVLFCGAVLQNFFDLPASQIGEVWAATGAMLKGIRDLPGVTVLGTLDDDETMVGTSPNGWPPGQRDPRNWSTPDSAPGRNCTKTCSAPMRSTSGRSIR